METLRHGNIELQRNELHNFFHLASHEDARFRVLWISIWTVWNYNDQDFQSSNSNLFSETVWNFIPPEYSRRKSATNSPQRKKDSKHFDLLFEEKCPKEEKSENFRSFIIVASPFSRGEGGRKREADAFFFYSAASSRERLLWKP